MLKDVSQTTEASRLSKVAGENISANKIVYAEGNEVFLATNTDISHSDRILGISVSSALLGETILIQTFGELKNDTWTWDDTKLLWLGVNGEITQTPPSPGFTCIIGSAIDSNRIFINIKDSIS